MFFVTIRPDYYFLHCNLQVRVRVSDLLGRSLGKMEVTVESGMRSSDGLTIMSQTKMSESKKDHTVYEVDMMKAKPARGFYDLTINAGIELKYGKYLKNHTKV